MNRNRLLMIGVMALGLGALVSYVVYNTLRKTVASVKEANTQVVVAATDMQVGSKIEDKNLREIKLPGGELPAGYYQHKGELLGRGVILPISKGEFVLPGMVKLVVQKRKARMGRNPATGEAIKIPAKTVVKARIAKQLKDAVLPKK